MHGRRKLVEWLLEIGLVIAMVIAVESFGVFITCGVVRARSRNHWRLGKRRRILNCRAWMEKRIGWRIMVPRKFWRLCSPAIIVRRAGV